MSDIGYNTVESLADRTDKPIMFHVSLYIISDLLDSYSLYFTFDDVNFYYIQREDGHRKLYRTLDAAYIDVCKIDGLNGVMLVTPERNTVGAEYSADD